MYLHMISCKNKNSKYLGIEVTNLDRRLNFTNPEIASTPKGQVSHLRHDVSYSLQGGPHLRHDVSYSLQEGVKLLT